MKEAELELLLAQLYRECEHGDDEHRGWLKDKFIDFLRRYKSGELEITNERL